MKDLGLDSVLARVLGDLVVDDAVAQVLRIRLLNRVAINAVGRQVVVDLVAHFDLLAFAEMDLLITRRYGIYAETQRVELFYHVVGDDRVGEQSRGEVLLATPCVRCIKDTDRLILMLLSNNA